MNFVIDERATIGSILDAIRKGNKAEHIAKTIDGISQKPLLKALKDAGYEYSQKAPKGWHYIGEGIEPTEKSIFDYVNSSLSNVKRNSPRGEQHVKRSSPTVHTEFIHSNTGFTHDNTEYTESSSVVHAEFTRSNAEVASSNTDFTPNSPIVHPQFTHDEVRMISEMLHEWKQSKLNRPEQMDIEEPSPGVAQVHERIKELHQGDKTRKTIVIDKGIGDRLDAYCKKERVNKSDVLHLALMDFLDGYE